VRLGDEALDQLELLVVGHGDEISGVLTADGSSGEQLIEAGLCDERISARRPVAYMPSSKPYQRSPKNI
jgi:hypothetical protein